MTKDADDLDSTMTESMDGISLPIGGSHDSDEGTSVDGKLAEEFEPLTKDSVDLDSIMSESIVGILL